MSDKVTLPSVGATGAVHATLKQIAEQLQSIDGRLDRIDQREEENAAAHARFQETLESHGRILESVKTAIEKMQGTPGT